MRPICQLRAQCRQLQSLLVPSASSSSFHPDFRFFPNFFSATEQRTLLMASLRKLDSMESRDMSRRRRDFMAKRPNMSRDPKNSEAVDNCFLPDEYYHFEEGHFDGVIRRYREMHVSSWNDASSDDLLAVLKRLEGLYPTDGATQMHLLHLASDGEIFPHVDNIGASGSWILGVSLGAQRVLHMEAPGDSSNEEVFDILLPSGSVYIQRDSIRYQYKHSIQRAGISMAETNTSGQRLSVMVRDRLPPGNSNHGLL